MHNGLRLVLRISSICLLSLLFHQLLATPAPSLKRHTFISVNFKHCKFFFYFIFKSFYTKIHAYNFLERSKKNALSDLLKNFQVRIFQVGLYIQLLYHKTLWYTQKELSNTLVLLLSIPAPIHQQCRPLLCISVVQRSLPQPAAKELTETSKVPGSKQI